MTTIRQYHDDDEISAEDEHILRWTEDGVYVKPEPPRVVEVYGGRFQVQFNIAPHTWSAADVPEFDTREQAEAFAARAQ